MVIQPRGACRGADPHVERPIVRVDGIADINQQRPVYVAGSTCHDDRQLYPVPRTTGRSSSSGRAQPMPTSGLPKGIWAAGLQPVMYWVSAQCRGCISRICINCERIGRDVHVPSADPLPSAGTKRPFPTGMSVRMTQVFPDHRHDAPLFQPVGTAVDRYISVDDTADRRQRERSRRRPVFAAYWTCVTG